MEGIGAEAAYLKRTQKSRSRPVANMSLCNALAASRITERGGL
jgi:hypothetical protein